MKGAPERTGSDVSRITFVIPVFNEYATIRPVVEQILAVAQGYACRILLIDDGSSDGSAEVCDELDQRHPEVQAIHFSENKGKTVALAVGFDAAEGDVVITLDSDFQDDPAEIPRFVSAIRNGYDLVCGWKADRKDPLFKRVASRIYNGVTARLFGLSLHDINCGFKAMRIDVAKSLALEHDYHRLIPVLAAAAGYRVGEIKIRHHPRRSGKSKYGIERYWRGLRDVGRVWWRLHVGHAGQRQRP